MSRLLFAVHCCLGFVKQKPHYEYWCRAMKTLSEIRTILRQQGDIVAERYGIAIVGVFGSYARGGQASQSDLDLLVEKLRPVSLLELVGAEIYLSGILGVRVDLVPRRNVREELRESILREAVSL